MILIRKRLALAAVIVLALAGCRKKPMVAGASAIPSPEPAAKSECVIKLEPKVEVMSFEEQWGIEVESIGLTSADYMLDFRYRVRDPNKAIPVLRRSIKPYIVDKASGKKFIVPNPPKVGPLRQTTILPKADKTYFIMFVNPGKFIKRGSLVDVVIGDFVAKDLIVK